MAQKIFQRLIYYLGILFGFPVQKYSFLAYCKKSYKTKAYMSNCRLIALKYILLK